MEKTTRLQLRQFGCFDILKVGDKVATLGQLGDQEHLVALLEFFEQGQDVFSIPTQLHGITL